MQFRAGDTVKVCRIIVSPIWVGDMDYTVGLTGTIREIYHTGSVDVLLEDGESWVFPITALKE